MKKLAEIIDKGLFLLIGISFLTLFLLNVANIFLRTFTSTSLLWVVDFSQLLVVWIVGFGAVIALHRKEHLLIGFIKEKFPRNIELSIELVTRVLLLIFYGVLVVTGIEVAQVRMNIAYVTLGWPTGLAYWSMPVTGSLMILFAILSLTNVWSGFKKTAN
ncbi:TRAP transporter small permease [Alkalihalobacillus oceani]|uniref:TRAP transporter small permease n=1 Tax=Halalkalibacter oceani TaxID=1653776 RepID=A0A9X2IQP6_9BACI|nr:TRAP transporter small permease [Halalkalibacter oceani]MCM3714773.1 TRAP transporter small permease [Halalkalibacter oceani]